MVPIEEIDIAGIGRKFTISTHQGDKIVTIVHDAGMLEVYHSPAGQLDTVIPVASVDDEKARQAAAIIGRTIYRTEAVEKLSRQGSPRTWHTLLPQAYATGKSLVELGLSHQTSVSVIAVAKKNGNIISSPGPAHVMTERSQLEPVGTPKAIQASKALLDKGSF